MASANITTQTNSSYEIALINEKMTGPPAGAILEASGIFDTAKTGGTQLQVLDNASGIGTLIFRLIKHDPPPDFQRIVGADIDENYVSGIRRRAAASNETLIEALRLDQQTPGLDDASFTHIFNNFGIFFAPNDTTVLTETYRMLKQNGIAGFTSWAKISWWDEILVPSLKRYLPGAPSLPHPMKLFPSSGWDDPNVAKEKLQNAGFLDVQSRVYSFVPEIAADEFARACAVLVKAVASRAWEQAAREEFEAKIEAAFRDFLYAEFADGRWKGQMSAVLTWGSKL